MRALTLAALALILTACGPTREVPRESCNSAPTGRVREDMTMTCFAYNANGTCSNQMPVYTTYREVVTTCTFKEWR